MKKKARLCKREFFKQMAVYNYVIKLVLMVLIIPFIYL